LNVCNFSGLLKQAFKESIDLKQSCMNAELDDLVFIAEEISKSILNGGKLLICGNGGSAADSQHLAAELIVRLSKDFDRDPIRAISLVPDSATITACSNDYSFDVLFERQIQSIGQPGDALLLISTSGNSKNLIAVAACAKKMNISTLALLGGSGGILTNQVDYSYVVKSFDTARVQEVHILIEHTLAKYIENKCCIKD